MFTALVFFAALYFSINLFIIVAAKISSMVVNGCGTIDLLLPIVPAFFWALFYYLVNL